MALAAVVVVAAVGFSAEAQPVALPGGSEPQDAVVLFWDL